MEITDNEKWHAVVNCDRGCDGRFFYGVKTTGVFCKPSCRSKTPVRANVAFFDNAPSAIELGFRPCKRCCPDQTLFEPFLELIKKAKDMFEAECDKPVDLNRISQELGVSKNHLTRLFKQHLGLTPTQYITGIKVNKAEKLLKETNSDILEIAHAAGFQSVSNFYRCFKEQTGRTPNEHRKVSRIAGKLRL